MIIIADGGSTKTSWCIVDGTGKKIFFNTEGYNPYFSDTEYIIASMKKNMPSDMPADAIKEVANLIDAKQVPGDYEVKWNIGSSKYIQKGIYFAKLQIGQNMQTIKIMMEK